MHVAQRDDSEIRRDLLNVESSKITWKKYNWTVGKSSLIKIIFKVDSLVEKHKSIYRQILKKIIFFEETIHLKSNLYERWRISGSIPLVLTVYLAIYVKWDLPSWRFTDHPLPSKITIRDYCRFVFYTFKNMEKSHFRQSKCF